MATNIGRSALTAPLFIPHVAIFSSYFSGLEIIFGYKLQMDIVSIRLLSFPLSLFLSSFFFSLAEITDHYFPFLPLPPPPSPIPFPVSLLFGGFIFSSEYKYKSTLFFSRSSNRTVPPPPSGVFFSFELNTTTNSSSFSRVKPNLNHLTRETQAKPEAERGRLIEAELGKNSRRGQRVCAEADHR